MDILIYGRNMQIFIYRKKYGKKYGNINGRNMETLMGRNMKIFIHRREYGNI